MVFTAQSVAVLSSIMVIVLHLIGLIGLETCLIFLLLVVLGGISYQHFVSSEKAILLFQNLRRVMKKLLDGIMKRPLWFVVLCLLLIVGGVLSWLIGKVVHLLYALLSMLNIRERGENTVF